MGKLAEKMKKAVTKAKAKVAAKTGKCGRNAKECAKAAVVLVAFAALAALLTGCATTGEQPARSQTMTNEFKDCVIIANARSVALDTKAKTLDADADTMSAPLELWTQTQANEGSETISPTASPTLDIKPDINLHYNDALKNATDASKSVLESLSEASCKAVLGLMSSKQSGVLDVVRSDGTAAKVKCEDGQCSFCTDC